MISLNFGPILALGRVIITPNAIVQVPAEDLVRALEHEDGDQQDQQDSAEIDRHRPDDRLRSLSAYRASNGTIFWVITETDLSRTTVMLPEDDEQPRNSEAPSVADLQHIPQLCAKSLIPRRLVSRTTPKTKPDQKYPPSVSQSRACDGRNSSPKKRHHGKE